MQKYNCLQPEVQAELTHGCVKRFYSEATREACINQEVHLSSDLYTTTIVSTQGYVWIQGWKFYWRGEQRGNSAALPFYQPHSGSLQTINCPPWDDTWGPDYFVLVMPNVPISVERSMSDRSFQVFFHRSDEDEFFVSSGTNIIQQPLVSACFDDLLKLVDR